MNLSACVIVLGFNGLSYLEDCLSSVVDQTTPTARYEVVYADNGSDDGSLAYVREHFPQVRPIDLGLNHGYARGNNLGLEAVTADIVVFLNQDTVVAKGWLAELLRLFEDESTVVGQPAVLTPWHPEYRWGRDATAGYMMDASRWGYIRYLPPADHGALNLYASGASLAVRREWLANRGYAFEELFHSYAEDLELALAARAEGRTVRFAPGAVVVHKHRLASVPTAGTLIKTVRIIRNRFLAFYLHATALEMAPVMLLVALGAPLNSGEFGLSGVRRLLYGSGLALATFVALPMAVAAAIQLRKTRRRNLRSRRQPQWCLLRTLWSQPP